MHSAASATRPSRGNLALRIFVLAWLAALLVLPIATIVYRTFENGLAPAIDAITTPEALNALKLTIMVTLICVPLNAIFGVAAALVLVRHRFRGASVIDSLVDIPFALSPIVIGLALLLVYGREGWLGQWLVPNGHLVIFAFPGLVLATLLVTLPFVVREVVPVLREIGDEQEQAASTLGASRLQIFRRITLPAIRAGLIYGVILSTARALGEFGAVSVVSGHLIGKTQTLTLHVEERFVQFDQQGAYAAALVLALLAVATLVAMRLLDVGRHRR